MPTMSGAIGWMDRMNSNNRKPPPASCTEMHPALVKMGAKLMEMPAFVCFFVCRMGIFAVK